MQQGVSIPKGVAIVFDHVGNTWAIGLVDTVAGERKVHPMREHLEREIAITAQLDDAVPFESLQRQLPELPVGDPFGPFVEMREGTVIASRTQEDSGRYQLFEVAEDIVHPFGSVDLEQPFHVRRFEPGVGGVGEILELPRANNMSVRFASSARSSAPLDRARSLSGDPAHPTHHGMERARGVRDWIVSDEMHLGPHRYKFS